MTSSPREAIYEYEFAIWPRESSWESSVYDIFRMQHRQVHEFTHSAWVDFRASLERQGFTLREVERWPKPEREAVL